MKKLAKVIANLSLKTASNAAAQASDWCIFQVKEPKDLKQMIRR